MFVQPKREDMRCDGCGVLILGKTISVNGQPKTAAYSKEGTHHKKHYCIDCAIRLGFVSFQQGFNWYANG